MNQKLNDMLQGLMFLSDGRVLIMDSELFKQTIEKSIVLDLFDGTSLSNNNQYEMAQIRDESVKEEEKLVPR